MFQTKSGTPLPGDWRRRAGTVGDAHLYRPYNERPCCGRVIRRDATMSTRVGRPCRDCLAHPLGLPSFEP